ncbi:response regulator transcription factor [Cohnella thailandensis]|uniref:Response regulator transcription factor n=1 Tax=Cohnella thailandensis TaxID=557557 RepID=A0A841T3K7_9BACL|nr:response regulator transcription factor [Cohnella thailandensis]MBB6637579.1 response regulator transcription factor [Cohnella thailandensis]MBP1974245.1 two-component system response regulator YesN [Cohnella thailandensis]
MYKVFLVDDEPFITEGLMDAIDWPAYGLEVVGSAENGEEALERLRHTPVDILITDISMPLMNGLDLIRRARELHPDLKAVILSGFNEFDYLKEGLMLGIENYLLKPINVKELQDTLRNAADKLLNSRSDARLHEYNVQIMRDNTLYRWMNGRISKAELNERAELLGLSLDAPYGIVALLRREPSGLEEQEEALERIASAFDGRGTVIPFRDLDGDIVVLAGLSSPEEDRSGLALELKRIASPSANGTPARLSFGSPHPLLSSISDSYREAKKAQEFFMIDPDREWIDYEDTVPLKKAELGEFPIDWEAYRKLLVTRDKEKLSEDITADFERLRLMEGMTPAWLQEVALELIIRFKMELKAIKHSDEPELFEGGIGQANSASHYAELAEAVRQVAERCVDSLAMDVRSPVVRQVLNEIEEHYADELSLKTLGTRFHIHPVYLGQLFQKEIGESFTEHINKYRIEQAKRLLKTSSLKVHDIARQVGYWETGYFYKQFKKFVGVSPSEFKGLH